MRLGGDSSYSILRQRHSNWRLTARYAKLSTEERGKNFRFPPCPHGDRMRRSALTPKELPLKSAGSLTLAICVYLAAMSVWAHNRSTSVLRGQVTVDGQPVAHAGISLFLLRPKVPGAYGRNIVSRTSDNGTYEVASLPKGDYVVLVWKQGIRLYQGKVHIGESDNIKDIATATYRPAASPRNASRP
jgi:hypothetical protein